MNNLEELLNKLIKLGRKPRGIKEADIAIKENVIYLEGNGIFSVTYSLNDLCSIDSGLRQFVVEKRLYKDDDNWVINNNYWLMKSAIVEDKKQFILDNILIDE